MYKVDYQIKLLNNVLSASFDGKNALFQDNAYGLFLYSISDKQLRFGKRLAKNLTPHHIYSKAASTSKDGYVFLSTGDGECKLYQVSEQSLELRNSVRWHKLDISSAAFSEDSSLVVSGGEDGRVYVYTTQDLKFYALCPVQPDYISCLCLDSKNHYLAFGTYEKKIIIYDLRTLELTLELQTPSVCMDIKFYNQDCNFFYICNEGEVGHYDLLAQTGSARKITNIWLQCCLLDKEGRYAYVAGRDRQLWVLSLANLQDVITIPLPESGVSCLHHIGEYLCICFINGKIIFIILDHQKTQFTLLLKDSFEQAKLLAEEQNIFLKLDDNYLRARKKEWNLVRPNVLKLFTNHQPENAISLAKPFLEDPDIQIEFNTLLENTELLNEFLKAIAESQYQKAYQIADKRPAIKNLAEYKNLEEYFEKILNAAKKMLDEDYQHNIYPVRKLLKPFEGIPGKKERVQIVLENFMQYNHIQSALKNQDYKSVYTIGQEYPFLKITKAYKFALNYYEEMLITLQHEILNQPSPDLIASLDILESMQDFSENAKQLRDLYTGLNDFNREAKNHAYAQCYAILDSIPALASSNAYLDMENHILSAFNKATALAQDGNTLEVYNILSEFLAIRRWKKRLDNIFQISYFYEMKRTDMKDLKWKDTLQQYCSFFGKGVELAELCQLKGISDIYDRINPDETSEVLYLKSIFKT